MKTTIFSAREEVGQHSQEQGSRQTDTRLFLFAEGVLEHLSTDNTRRLTVLWSVPHLEGKDSIKTTLNATNTADGSALYRYASGFAL